METQEGVVGLSRVWGYRAWALQPGGGGQWPWPLQEPLSLSQRKASGTAGEPAGVGQAAEGHLSPGPPFLFL